ncbi:hypothetical protein F4802DRAFT_257300 [Xylaria palmicola]|nr:hypothetical protein F4802DRAFT_257300 [Xylaria palmicola]
MDKYESVHGKDVSSFDFTSTHRLPTVSAAQALDDLKTDRRQFLPTGLETLDHTLAGVSPDDGSGPLRCRGIRKGQILEVWGPPASGKTTLALQIAANALQDGCKVVWVGQSAFSCLGEPVLQPGWTAERNEQTHFMLYALIDLTTYYVSRALLR